MTEYEFNHTFYINGLRILYDGASYSTCGIDYRKKKILARIDGWYRWKHYSKVEWDNNFNRYFGCLKFTDARIGGK